MSKFEEILADMLETHRRKRADYGTGEDPYGNFRPAEKFGVPAWVGCLIRQTDKIARLQSFVQKGRLENESVEDSLRDNAVYAIIAYALYMEDVEQEEEEVKEQGGLF